MFFFAPKWRRARRAEEKIPALKVPGRRLKRNPTGRANLRYVYYDGFELKGAGKARATLNFLSWPEPVKNNYGNK